VVVAQRHMHLLHVGWPKACMYCNDITDSIHKRGRRADWPALPPGAAHWHGHPNLVLSCPVLSSHLSCSCLTPSTILPLPRSCFIDWWLWQQSALLQQAQDLIERAGATAAVGLIQVGGCRHQLPLGLAATVAPEPPAFSQSPG
jgi:hypothetical protein